MYKYNVWVSYRKLKNHDLCVLLTWVLRRYSQIIEHNLHSKFVETMLKSNRGKNVFKRYGCMGQWSIFLGGKIMRRSYYLLIVIFKITHFMSWGWLNHDLHVQFLNRSFQLLEGSITDDHIQMCWQKSWCPLRATIF